MSNRAGCFVDMPFGKSPALASGVDFDHIYEAAIRPAIEDAGLGPIGGGEEAMKEAQRLAPLVILGIVRRDGASSSDYWELATVKRPETRSCFS